MLPIPKLAITNKVSMNVEFVLCLYDGLTQYDVESKRTIDIVPHRLNE
jgi:hypothetical protein